MTVASRPRARSVATQDRRRAILDAALRCFSEHGYSRTQIQEVRRLSGASTGSIYHHFGDKEGLAAALYADGLERYQEAMLSCLEGAETAEAAVRGVVVEHFAWVRRNPDLARFLGSRREASVVVAGEAAVRKLNRRFSRRAYAWLRDARDAGAVRDAPLPVLMAVVMGPCQELTRLADRRAEMASRAEVSALAEIVWQGARARSGQDS